jgi:hypothetical protein
MAEKIGNTEALEKYLQLERDNQYYQDELENYRKSLAKSRQAYSDLSKKVDAFFQWLEEEGLLETAGKKMALLFEFAYMEAHFEDLRSKWPSESAKNFARKAYPSNNDNKTEGTP